MYCEMRSQSTCQRVGHSGIIFENNNTLSHRTPVLQPVVNGGRQRWTRAAGWAGNATTPQTSKALESLSEIELPACRGLFCERLEWFSLKLPVFLQQDFDLAFCLLQFFPAGGRKLHTFFKERQRLLQRDLSLFQFLNYLLQSLEALLKLGQRGFAPSVYCNATKSALCPVFSAKIITRTERQSPTSGMSWDSVPRPIYMTFFSALLALVPNASNTSTAEL